MALLSSADIHFLTATLEHCGRVAAESVVISLVVALAVRPRPCRRYPLAGSPLVVTYPPCFPLRGESRCDLGSSYEIVGLALP